MLRGSGNIITAIIVAVTLIISAIVGKTVSAPVAPFLFAVGVVLSLSPRIIQEWERGVLLRLGTFRRILNPGVVWVIPGIETITAAVDMRIRSTPFSAEKTLTKDTVPVNVDAVLFWVVTDAQRAILEVEQYLPTISWAAQVYERDATAMRLRAMNMTYESIKERGALMVVPSGMVESLDPGSVMGLAAAGYRSGDDNSADA